MDKTFIAGLKGSRLLRDPERLRKIVGWDMKPDDVMKFFKSLNMQVVSLFGYSADYEDGQAMLEIVKNELSKYSPKEYVINIGVTKGGIGAAYPLAKSMGFTTTGIVSKLALEYADEISTDVDHICFVTDETWGGMMPGTNELAPTSKAMVSCTDIFIGIGGNEITRDELLAGNDAGKPMQFYPAEMHHEGAIKRAQKNNKPIPTSFHGAAHHSVIERQKK